MSALPQVERLALAAQYRVLNGRGMLAAMTTPGDEDRRARLAERSLALLDRIEARGPYEPRRLVALEARVVKRLMRREADPGTRSMLAAELEWLLGDAVMDSVL